LNHRSSLAESQENLEFADCLRTGSATGRQSRIEDECHRP
jgi:hypothetical protein